MLWWKIDTKRWEDRQDVVLVEELSGGLPSKIDTLDRGVVVDSKGIEGYFILPICEYCFHELKTAMEFESRVDPYPLKNNDVRLHLLCDPCKDV